MVAVTYYYVRPMTMADIDQVSDIDREAFPATWPPTTFKRELEHNRLSRYLVAVENFEGEVSSEASQGWPRRLLLRWARKVSEAPPTVYHERVCGYVGIWLTVDEAHIVSIAVRALHRRRGIGELLLMATIDLALSLGKRVVSLEVRVSNDGAQRLYDKYGFKKAGIRSRYYSDNYEDAIIMTTDSIDSPDYQELLQLRRSQYEERWGNPRIAFD